METIAWRFFFQAEDGIRDDLVTGVQTCALPISHHLAASSGSQCYDCHMPHTTYGVLKAIRSHQVGSPRVADELATGRPNACNLCHLDKPLAWTAHQLDRKSVV